MQKTNNHRIRDYWLPFIVWIVAILIGATIPIGHYIHMRRGIDKWVHGFEFFVLVLLALRAFSHARQVLFKRAFFFVSILFSVLLGLFIEVYQSLLPWRRMDFADFWSDVVGIAIASFVFFIWRLPRWR